MNNDKIKACFEAISPDKEQKERMLANISKRTASAKPPIAFYKYASIAAVLVLTFVGMYYGLKQMTLPTADNSAKLTMQTGTASISEAEESPEPDVATPELYANVAEAELSEDNNAQSISDTQEKKADDIVKENTPSQSENIADSTKKENIPTKNEPQLSSPPPADNDNPTYDSETDSADAGGASSDNTSSDIAVTDKPETGPPLCASGGGGGGSSGASSSKPTGGISGYDKNESAAFDYSPYVPLIAPSGYQLADTSVYANTVTLTYISDTDRISIKITPDNKSKATVSLEELRSCTTQSPRLSISLAMGDYRADINAPASMGEELYKAFKSCRYFK